MSILRNANVTCLCLFIFPLYLVEIKKWPCPMSLSFWVPYRCRQAPCRPVEFKKSPCHPVELRGQGPSCNVFAIHESCPDRKRAYCGKRLNSVWLLYVYTELYKDWKLVVVEMGFVFVFRGNGPDRNNEVTAV